ncbi:putative nuclease HARBI1 [Hylaeus volcanicus]|uniref:putative nuclease HARBI1 n=1 Tax=Hylaeus volcanicus TaxID=313075 RepID=UPI0023B7B1C3|nr:putative nuclease HARBI1 [Hylaeus volcanicus]
MVKVPEKYTGTANSQTFYQGHGFPGVIGCIDCTHVAIVAPGINDPEYPEHIYVNRKGYRSINVQLVCDPDLRIIHVNARFPGSTHDNYILNNTNILPALKSINEYHGNGFYLLGDSGYPLRPWLLTPINDTRPGTPEAVYSDCLKKARSLIERYNGILKLRFRCLLKHKVLHYNPNTASKIINACVVLHNMCIQNGLPAPQQDEEKNEVDLGIYNHVPQVEDLNTNVRRANPDLARGRALQQHIIRSFFT